MYYPVTVEQAIKRGKQTVSYPLMGISIVVFALSFLGFLISWEFVVIGMALSFLLPLLYWSIMISRWRLWAFENVRNVHELKRRAISNNLIWPDGSFFERVEIRTPSQKLKWLQLEDRFKLEDNFQEDFTIPSQTIIGYSKSKLPVMMALSLLAVGILIYELYTGSSDTRAWMHAIIEFLALTFWYILQKGGKPQVILCNEGVEIAGAPFYTWSQISNERVVTPKSHFTHNSIAFFEYNTPYGSSKIEISDFDIGIIEFERLLVAYRSRHNNRRRPATI